jgi:VWFA-related protein
MFRPANCPKAIALVLRVGVPTLACVVLAAGPQAIPQAAQQPPAAQPAQDQPARPTFRLGASYVRVDAYPTRNGEPVPDLERAEFELLEDGVPQKIEQFERISLQTTTDRDSRRDPNTVAESRGQVADPRRRVFVVFLDTGMTTIEGSHAARRPIVDMLDRLIGDDDLFAVMTPDMGAQGITFARRTESLDAELAKYWTWGQRDALVRRDPEEVALETCFPDPAPEKYCTGPRGERLVQPSNAYRGVAAQLIERRSEQRALSALDDLVSELGALREERKAVIVLSQGWRLLEPKPALVRLQECDRAPLPGMPGVSPGGRIVSDAGAARGAAGMDSSECHAQAIRYASADNASLFRQLVERANRFNVSFYPFDTRGLGVFDRSIGARDDRIRGDPGERAEAGRIQGPLVGDMNRLQNRVTSLQTLADATDGLAVVNTNDLTGGARRIVNDLSTYYLLGYQSTNTKLDGRWRNITVRVRTPGVQMRARKGYRALTEAEVALLRSGDAPAAATGTPTPAGQTVTVAGAAAVSRLIEPLVGLDRAQPWRSRAAWSAAASPGRTRLWIASEIDEATLRQPEWASGGTGTATLVLPNGQPVADVTLQLEPGSRAIEASLDAQIPASTEVIVRLRLSPAGGGLPLSDTLRVTPSGTSARLFRRGPTTGRQFIAAGAPRFRRTEHARVAVPIKDPSSAIEAALIDRTGAPLRIPVASRVETIDGSAWALGEVSLAPLSPGDYVLRMSIGQGAGAPTSLTAIRIVN